METTITGQPLDKRQSPPDATPRVVWASVVWNIILAIACVWLSITIFQLTEFGNLGQPVQYFAGVVVLLPGALGLFAALRLVQRRGSGRYISMSLFFVGMVLATAVLFQQWGVFNSFELLVDGVMANQVLMLGFPLAYAFFWVAGRFFAEASGLRSNLETIALGIGMLTLVALLFFSGLLDGFSHVLGTYSQPATWVITAAVAIFAVLSYQLLHLGDYYSESTDARVAWQGWLMLSPNIIGFSVFFAGPLLLSLYLSFTNSSVGQVPEFIGLQNYAEILSLELQSVDNFESTAQSALSFGYSVLGDFRLGDTRLVLGAKDTLFWYSLRNTLLFCLLLLPLAVIPALGLSLILNSKLPGVKFFRAIYFLPSVAAVVGTALIWRWLYNPTIGYINYAVTGVVTWFNTTFGLGLTDPNIQWLTDPAVVLFSMVLLSAWGVVGYNTVLFLAGLQGIPNSLYEAAQIDGANRWAQFRNVTLPMLAPTTFFVMITTIVTGLQVFNEPYTLFPAQPIPVNATTSVYYLYRRGFFFFEFGYASAIAWLLFGIIFSITLLQFRLQRSDAYE